MKGYSVQPNKNIFTVYAGLIASGYDLSELNCDTEIYKLLRKVQIKESIVSYFRRARTLSCKVNPYWPRAFLLSLSSLYITEKSPYTYKDFEKLLNHIMNLSQINPKEKNEDLIDWIHQLPSIIEKLQHNAEIQQSWLQFLSVLIEKTKIYDLIVKESYEVVKNNLDVLENDLPEIIIIPNYLQAPQVTDVVAIEEKIYVINSNPDKESIIHELLHQVFDNKLEECKDLIDMFLPLLKPVLDEMINYQYAWSYNEDSWNRVFEENLIRAASAWTNYNDDINNARKNAESHKEYGFIYVPIIFESFILNWKGINEFRGFIKNCLNACSN